MDSNTPRIKTSDFLNIPDNAFMPIADTDPLCLVPLARTIVSKGMTFYWECCPVPDDSCATGFCFRSDVGRSDTIAVIQLRTPAD